jgi:hypothetical protein
LATERTEGAENKKKKGKSKKVKVNPSSLKLRRAGRAVSLSNRKARKGVGLNLSLTAEVAEIFTTKAQRHRGFNR